MDTLYIIYGRIGGEKVVNNASFNNKHDTYLSNMSMSS